MTKVQIESLSRKAQLHRFSNQSSLNLALADAIAEKLRAAIATNQRASIAFSGGNTPAPMLRQLSAAKLEWQNVNATLVDERWVDTSHPDSNEAQLRKTLMRDTAAQLNFIALKSNHSTPEDGLETINQNLAALYWPLDCVHLGMGTDGHTASWFADAYEYARAINRTYTSPVIALNPQTAPHPRISLSANAILNAKSIFLHITGEEKLDVLMRAINGDKSLPIRVALSGSTPVNIYWAP